MISCVRALVRAIAQRSCGGRTPSSSADIVQASRVARLLLEPRPVDRAAVEPRRRPGLEPPLPQADLADLVGQAPPTPARRAGRRRPLPRRRRSAHRGMCRWRSPAPGTQAARRWSRRRRSGRPRSAGASASATISSTPLSRDQLGDRRAIESAVGLDARALHRRPLAAVEHAAVDRGAVGGARHQSVEHVELADQMALADAADRRVARHLAEHPRRGRSAGRRARRDAPRRPQPRTRHGRRR